jgi:hypothetical protein
VKVINAYSIVSSMLPDLTFCFNYENHLLGRIWVGWNPTNFDVSVLEKSAQSITCVVNSVKEKFRWFHTFVYAANQLVDGRPLWQELSSMKTRAASHPWIMRGDFNDVRNLAEKWGSDRLNSEVEFDECSDG